MIFRTKKIYFDITNGLEFELKKYFDDQKITIDYVGAPAQSDRRRALLCVAQLLTCLCWRPKTIFLSCPSTGALLPMQLLYDRFVIVLRTTAASRVVVVYGM